MEDGKEENDVRFGDDEEGARQGRTGWWD